MTLEEISEQIGISRTTIYKVLKDKGNVSEKTRAVVMEALEKYHYVENKNARNLALNRQYAIGYAGFRSKSAAYFSTEVRKGISRAVQEFGDDGLSILVLNLIWKIRGSSWKRWSGCWHRGRKASCWPIRTAG